MTEHDDDLIDALAQRTSHTPGNSFSGSKKAFSVSSTEYQSGLDSLDLDGGPASAPAPTATETAEPPAEAPAFEDGVEVVEFEPMESGAEPAPIPPTEKITAVAPKVEPGVGLLGRLWQRLVDLLRG